MRVQYPIDKATLEFALQELRKYNVEDDNRYKVGLCMDILLKIHNSPDMWQSLCPFNYNKEDTVSSFTHDLHHPIIDNKFNDRLLFLSLFFLREAILTEKLQEESSDKIEMWNRFLRSYEKLSKIVIDLERTPYSYPNSLAHYILIDLSIDVLTYHLKNKSSKIFADYNNFIYNAKENITKFESSLNDKIQIAEDLEKKLDTIKIGANFIGLSKGFSRLLEKKNCAKNIAAFILLILGIIVLIPVGYESYKLSEFYINKENFSFSWQEMLPIFGLELILIYFFRIVLNHYFSLQTQIMQLDLRLSLCQFIQSYASYAKDIKAKDKDALDKFENLIFSSIVSDPKKVPGTFDGVESLASLVQALKGDKS